MMPYVLGKLQAQRAVPQFEIGMNAEGVG